MVAYGLVAEAPWYYFVYLPVFMVAFAYIPCSLGAITCLLLISRLPHLRRIAVGSIALLVIGIAYFSIWQTLDIADADLLGAAWFQETFRRFEFTRGEWLPSTWLSNGLLDAARPQGLDPADLPWLESAKYLLVLVSNALILHLAVIWVGERVFRESYYGLNTRQARESKSGMAWFDRLAEEILFLFFPKETRLLILKDLRLFRRDPGAVVAIFDFLWFTAPLFLKHRSLPSAPIRLKRTCLGKRCQLSQFGSGRADCVDVHHSVYLPVD